jgi:recombination protein U
MKNMDVENYKKMIAGRQARHNGDYFERQILASIEWYKDHGVLEADKTPEPMKPLGAKGRDGRFLACYTKKAQVDFCGTMYGGRSIRFEAKQTDGDRFERKRLTDEQMEDLREHQRMGALCFVLCCFGLTNVYRVPWIVWDEMKARFGRLYVTEADLKPFRIPCTVNVIKFMDGIIDVNEPRPDLSLPDICVCCGRYAGEGSWICPTCRKIAEEAQT